MSNVLACEVKDRVKKLIVALDKREEEQRKFISLLDEESDGTTFWNGTLHELQFIIKKVKALVE